jgi:ABC-2 type transport system permease protein
VAQLDDRPAPAVRYIPATTHFLAIAWLRWRMFANSFRRQTGQRRVAGLVFAIIVRIIVWPVVVLWTIGPAVAAGFFAWMAVSRHHPEELIMLLAGLALLWQFVAVNGVTIAATVSNFDPTSLLQFPLPFGRYLVLRLLLGLLTPSTMIGCLALLAATIGIAVADLSLAPVAAVVLAVYAAMNIFFSRMIAAWLERWLATRRAREIFASLMAIFFVGIQALNFRHTGSHTHAAAGSWLLNLLHASNRTLRWLPPGFATNAIVLTGHPLARFTRFAALLAWTALFLAAFAIRLHKQFLGEYLSEGAPRSAPAVRSPRSLRQPRAPAILSERSSRSPFSPTVTACLRKEWICLRGNGTQLIGMLTPLVFVFIFARGMLARHPSYLLSGSVGYALLGLLGAQYNIFGADGPGVQLYLLTPIRLRDVILAKNITSMALLLVEATLAWCFACMFAGISIPLPAQISAAFWTSSSSPTLPSAPCVPSRHRANSSPAKRARCAPPARAGPAACSSSGFS